MFGLPPYRPYVSCQKRRRSQRSLAMSELRTALSVYALEDSERKSPGIRSRMKGPYETGNIGEYRQNTAGRLGRFDER